MANGKITERIEGPFGSDADFQRAVIVNSFLDFGFEPSEAEVAQLLPTAAGTGGFERGRAAVADFAQTMLAEQERQENDPLKKFTEEQGLKIGEFEQQAQSLFEELRGIIGRAPQLFGALDEGQIDQLLAPLQRATAESSARTEGAFARRGLTGGTPESQALAEQERIFRENALATGLQVGLSQQQLEAQAVANRQAQLFDRSGALTQLVGQGTSQLSAQDLNQLQFLAGLPLLERGVAAQERAALEAGQGKKDFLGGTLSGGLSGAATGFMLGGPYGALAGGVAGAGLGAAGTAFGQGGTTSTALQAAPFLAALSQRPSGGSTLIPDHNRVPRLSPIGSGA